jgi:thymidylate synthase
MKKLSQNSYESLDDILHDVFEDLLAQPFNVKNTRGTSSEIVGLSIKLNNPRARLSRSEIKAKAFSAIGELLWYLSGSNELAFIEHYISAYKKESDDGVTIYGAYGPRLLNMRDKFNQLDNVTKLLRNNPGSRKAVIQIFDAMDIAEKHFEIPCTCTIQFLIRDHKLTLYVSMRSNDAFKGLPHDVFAFTMLQEIMAVKLGVGLGSYHHSIGSLHLYDTDKSKAKKYLNEGYQPTNLNMPEMPIGDPWPSIQSLLKFEDMVRNGNNITPEALGLDKYWTNLAKMLIVYNLFKGGKQEDTDKIKQLLDSMDSVYKVYIEPRMLKLLKAKG